MATWTILLTAGTSTLAALIGAITGGWLSRQGEDRKWYREKQLDSYKEFLRSCLTITIGFKRANADRRPFDYDWATWGVASQVAQMLASKELAAAIREFHSEVMDYVGRTNRDTINDPLDSNELVMLDERLKSATEVMLAAMEESLIGKRR